MDRKITYSIENQVGTLTINRPQARNALDWAAQNLFSNLVRDAAANLDLRALIITGSGTEAFASGGDLKELAVSREVDDGRRLISVMSETLKLLTELPLPVIAAINGDAVGGGCEILTACDLRISASKAKFRFAQAAVGLTTGWGGTDRLVRLVGLSQATKMLLTARSFTAQEALDMGFLHEIVSDDEDTLIYAQQLANKLASLPQGSLASTKRLVWAASESSRSKVKSLEEELFISLWSSEERRESMMAFLEKRKPNY